ncbi:epimerase [Ferrigenium kumadai]|uniref:Epimerase n=1 Tax=Ferrigenium kumadai TaxID=1682490 RepID=A0AAN1SZM0_9PROT|nr:NAD-dependent epimerase/dehydratase family protein [Ferrigenium kumadai]BBJ00031.1 epimerase [Ferrigenium kumadai]
MNCCVIGGAGFIGLHLVEALVAAGHNVNLFDRPRLVLPQHIAQHEAVNRFEGDFLNLDDLAPAIKGCEIVFHLVSTTLPRSSNENPVYDIETNVIGTLQLLDAARKNGIRKVIFISSGGTVYGIPQELPIPESHPTDPVCSYGISKLTIEKYMSLYKHLYDLDYCVLRLSNPFGERQRVSAAQGAVAVFLHKALRNELIEIWGDGSVVRDYFYISDAVSALVKAMTYDGNNRVLNIGSGAGLSLNEILTAIERLLGRSVNRSYLPPRPFDVPRNVLDISLATQSLDWRPQVPFTEGLARMARWMNEHKH